MTSPISDDAPAASRADLLFEWFRGNSRSVGIGAAVVVLVGSGYWLYGRSAEIKAANAEAKLNSAKTSLGSNNLILAQSDLKHVSEDYKGTPAGAEGTILLAQMDYDQKKYDDGIKLLQDALGSAPAPISAQMRALIGDGYIELNKPADGGKWYEDAAAATPYDGERAALKSRAGRAYAAAGNTEKAKSLWTELIDNSKYSAAAAEARVRLGEISAAQVGSAAPSPAATKTGGK